jgi:hypothetical protein
MNMYAERLPVNEDSVMLLKLYIWCWINLHPQYVLRRTAQFVGLSVLLLIPLLYLNLTIVQRGGAPTGPRFEINLSKFSPQGNLAQH